jgi:hypothetical protein
LGEAGFDRELGLPATFGLDVVIVDGVAPIDVGFGGEMDDPKVPRLELMFVR